MLRFFRSLIATVSAGFAVVGVFGACGGGGATCSADQHSVLDQTGATAKACATTEACAATGTSSNCVKCDPTKCLQNNDCIQGWTQYADYLKGDKSNQTTECRLKCSVPTDCPFNYHCVPSDSGQGYCAKDRTPSFLGGDYKPKQQGEAAAAAPWGVACQPGGGFDQNPDCDTAQQFWCYGTSPTDANAFCTQYQCGDDADCPGGWWCATVNDAPNVTSAKRFDWGTTTTVCLPRVYNAKPGSYCAPCKSDHDCPTNDSTPQHCVSADNNGGNELVCATECDDDKNCPLDYTCQDQGGYSACVPRAATCLTTADTAQFCSPCHSDDDCANINGYCVIADYSTEHYCTTKSGVACVVSNNTLTAQCPSASSTGGSNASAVSCSYNTVDFSFPKDQCYGLVNFGTGSNAAKVGGCWTKH